MHPKILFKVVHIRHIIYIFMTFVILLTCAVILFFFLDLKREKQFIEELALSQARSMFQKDLSLYQWVSKQGGIYIPLVETPPDNASLHHLSKHRLKSEEGQVLTLVNPGYIIHHMNEQPWGLNKELKSRMTHLNPSSPNNRPDVWEKEALLRLDATQKEVYATQTHDGKEYIRFMGAFVADESCIKCHQETKVGDVRGGISIRLPLNNYDEIAQKRARYSVSIYLFFWFFGLVSLGIAMYSLIKLLRKHHLLIEETHELRFLNQIDPLTKTFNRRAFEAWLRDKLVLYKTEQIDSCMLMIDIDFFKKINDTYGHLVGDRVLVELAHAIGKHVREGDCFARIGGEEFALLLLDTKIKRAYVIAERLRRIILDLKIGLDEPRNETLSLTISLGLSTFSSYDETIENIISRADKAMYLAKHDGRNKVRIEL